MQTLLHCVVLVCSATLPVACVAAQSSAPAGASFTLPAGEHRLEAFVDLLGQITRQPITCDDGRLGADERTVHVARDLRLGADAFEDVARTLLFRRGFVVVVDAQARRVVPLSRPELYVEQPRELPLDAVMARPACVAYVTTTLPCDAALAQRVVPMLMPLLSFRVEDYDLRIKQVESGVQLTGITDQVAYGVQLLRLANGEPLTAAAPLPWSDGPKLPWPGGKTTLGVFAASFAKALDADLLVDLVGVGAETPLDLGEADQLVPAAWFAKATQRLRGLDCIVVPLLPAQRVFELRPVRGPRADEATWRVRFEPSEEVGKAADVVPVATLYTPQHIGMRRAVGVLRTRMQGGASLTVSSLDGTRLLLVAPRDELAAAIAALHVADVK